MALGVILYAIVNAISLFNLSGIVEARRIPQNYLCLFDKIKKWCQDTRFCKKITVHWREKDHWLNLYTIMIMLSFNIIRIH